MTSRHLFVFLIFSAFIAAPLWPGITVVPKGVATAGQEIVFRINFKYGTPAGQSGTLKVNPIARGSKIPFPPTKVTDNGGQGAFRDVSQRDGTIEISCLLDSRFSPGRYVVTYTPAGDGWPVAAVLVVSGKVSLPDFMDKLAEGLFRVITQPSPVNPMDRKKEPIPEGLEFCNLWLLATEPFTVGAQLTTSGYCLSPSWSPDGKKVAYIYVNPKNGNGTLRIVGTKEPFTPREIDTAKAGGILDILWCGGETIALVTKSGLWTVTPGSPPVQLLDSSKQADSPEEILARAADRRSIVYTRRPAKDRPLFPGSRISLHHESLDPGIRGMVDIWKVNTVTGKHEPVVFHPAWLWYKSLSPDGKRMIYTAVNTGGGKELWYRQGTNFADGDKVGIRSANDSQPAWAPDGKRLVFVSQRPSVAKNNRE
ncbi:MAG: hypothetical protein GY765_11850 [bacterium]|nr:hypothetical protein [bacterium]